MALPKIDIPKYTVTLPSTKKPVEFRPFLVKEEKMLLLTQETNDEKMLANALKDIIKSCTFGKIEADTLTPYDVEYLFLQIRGKSIGEKISLQVKCEECSHTIPMNVMVDEIKVQYPEVEPESKIQVTDNVGIQLKQMTLDDITNLDVNDVNSVMSTVIETIYDSENVYPVAEADIEEVNNFIDSLDRKTMNKVEEFVLNQPKLSHTLEWQCPKCTLENKYVLEGLNNFFI